VKKILIVDDLKLFVEKQKSILNRADFKIFTAESGEEALNIHRNEKVDLIITNLDVAGIDGDQLCSIIRKDDSLKKVSIMLVYVRTEANIKRCSRSKANACIAKPIDSEEFLKTVVRLLNVPVRKSCRVLLKVSVEGKFLKESFFCFSLDISTTGILFETEKKLSKGNIITCSFFLPGSGQIETGGEVMRVIQKADNKYHYGIKFLRLKPKDSLSIERFIQKRIRESDNI
jgi:DNA-binding response OmpR family regulator